METKEISPYRLFASGAKGPGFEFPRAHHPSFKTKALSGTPISLNARSSVCFSRNSDGSDIPETTKSKRSVQ